LRGSGNVRVEGIRHERTTFVCRPGPIAGCRHPGPSIIAAAQLSIVIGVVARGEGGHGGFDLTGRFLYLLFSVSAILFAGCGWKRDAKRCAAVALIIGFVSVVTLVVISSRTWGNPRPGGSLWHRPSFE
jgi:hypothetical protein